MVIFFIALTFSICELVAECTNGFLFNDAQELAFLLTKYLDTAPGHNEILHKLQKDAAKTFDERWDTHWDAQVKESLFNPLRVNPVLK